MRFYLDIIHVSICSVKQTEVSTRARAVSSGAPLRLRIQLGHHVREEKQLFSFKTNALQDTTAFVYSFIFNNCRIEIC